VRLVQAGLSSLGRGEAQVRSNLDRVIGVLGSALGVSEHREFLEQGSARLEQNTTDLFGERRHDSYTRIMVTLPREAATQPELVAELIGNGMECARINCAHDSPDLWQRMIDNVRATEQSSGATVRIFMDLAGHKIRTGRLQSGPSVVRLKVPRDELGRRTGVAQAVLTCKSCKPEETGETALLPRLPVPEALLDSLKSGDVLAFTDTRKKSRKLQVRERLANGEWLAEITRNAYIVPGTPLYMERSDGGRCSRWYKSMFHVGKFDGSPAVIRLFRGDQLLLRRDTRPGRPAISNEKGERPAGIACSHEEAIDELKPGHAVWIDDGKLGCNVEQITSQGALLRVTHAGPKGVVVRSDKGINLPQTRLPLPALTAKDLEDLDFVCAQADMVGLSFVRQLDDVDELRRQLAERERPELPIVLKIETAAAVRNLPDILLGTMGQHRLAVMIARGDLAVELGSVRMAEIQEEILWICEAARVPVIWATQVLETLAKDGLINRPEITDAAMSVRAECVMLNKGPYIADAVRIIQDILTHMDAHQYKKISRLRRLHW
jgi:pyruvate kinase